MINMESNISVEGRKTFIKQIKHWSIRFVLYGLLVIRDIQLT